MRVELAALVLAAPGKSPAATARRIFALSYDLWEERFAVTAVDARSQSVSHLMQAAAEAWCIEQLAIPLSALGALGVTCRSGSGWSTAFWTATARRARPNSGYTLQGLIDLLSRRRKTESGVARSRGRPVPVRRARRVPAAMTLPHRLIAAFLASTLLPLAATVWITTTLLDRSLRYATTGELDRLSRTLESTAKQFYQRERDALKQDALAGRARPTMYPAADVVAVARVHPVVLGERRAGALRCVRGRRRARGLHAARGRSRRQARRRDLQPRPRRRQHGTTVHAGPGNAAARGRDRRARLCGAASR